MRTISEFFTTVKPSHAVLPACPSLWAAPVTDTPVFTIASRSAAAAAPSWPAALARPTSRVAATGAGYAGTAAAGTRRGVDRERGVLGGTAVGTRFVGTNGKQQQDQLHLMSRRDPRSWRPPA